MYACPCCGGDDELCMRTPSGCIPRTEVDDLPTDCDPLEIDERDIRSALWPVFALEEMPR